MSIGGNAWHDHFIYIYKTLLLEISKTHPFTCVYVSEEKEKNTYIKKRRRRSGKESDRVADIWFPSDNKNDIDSFLTETEFLFPC